METLCNVEAKEFAFEEFMRPKVVRVAGRLRVRNCNRELTPGIFESSELEKINTIEPLPTCTPAGDRYLKRILGQNLDEEPVRLVQDPLDPSHPLAVPLACQRKGLVRQLTAL